MSKVLFNSEVNVDDICIMVFVGCIMCICCFFMWILKSFLECMKL